MAEILELDGRTFVPAEHLSIPEWSGVTTQRLQPTLTLKDDDLFIITDTLGNIAGDMGDDGNASLGLFCRDTRFLSRLELQIEGRSPVLLSSTAQKGFALSVLCANPHVDNCLPAEVIGIQREFVLNGALFEELTITNYSRTPLQFELSLSFDADFADLFHIRGFAREQTGRLLRQVVEGSETEEDLKDFTALALDTGELTLAYEGLDGVVMESRLQFNHLQP
ncbi:MAG: amylo-alpha-1,6-glucosidase, partial [Oculatellaceae cyanobacterium Prado106]|nr:amylo-alpha-1,6-glucosidase [Oculatellaceae cyanobacterium Prado106]